MLGLILYGLHLEIINKFWIRSLIVSFCIRLCLLHGNSHLYEISTQIIKVPWNFWNSNVMLHILKGWKVKVRGSVLPVICTILCEILEFSLTTCPHPRCTLYRIRSFIMEILLQYFTFLFELFQSLLIYLSVTPKATVWLCCSCPCYLLSVHVKHPVFRPHPATWLSVLRTPPSCSGASAHAVCQSWSSVHSKARAHIFFMPQMFPRWCLGSPSTSTVDPVMPYISMDAIPLWVRVTCF